MRSDNNHSDEKMKGKKRSLSKPSKPDKAPLKVVDLFCGAGGMSLGFLEAGFDVVLAIDKWTAAVETYGRNNPQHDVKQFDLSDSDAISEIVKKSHCDIIIGGPPCQDFSTAGKKIEGDRANLTKSFAKIVQKVHPRFFVMENVPSAQQSKAFSVARKIFKAARYGLTEIVLDASYCGVPQRRKRFFCIGILNGVDDVLKPILTSRQTDLPTTLRDCFGNTLSFEYYYAHPRTYRRRAVFSVDEPAPTVRSGGNRPLPPDYKRHSSDPVDPDTHRIRALTTNERAALQMFPKTYQWSESRLDNELLISNAVPVGLSRFVGAALLAFINNPNTAVVPCFTRWLSQTHGLSDQQAVRVLSRYRKAHALVRPKNIGEDQLFEKLPHDNLFKTLSEQTRNQILEAVRLHLQFSTATP